MATVLPPPSMFFMFPATHHPHTFMLAHANVMIFKWPSSKLAERGAFTYLERGGRKGQMYCNAEERLERLQTTLREPHIQNPKIHCAAHIRQQQKEMTLV